MGVRAGQLKATAGLLEFTAAEPSPLAGASGDVDIDLCPFVCGSVRQEPFASPEQPGVGRIGVESVNSSGDVMDDDIARTCQQRLDLVAIAAVVTRVVVFAQSRLGAPRAEQDELTRLLGGEHAEVGALRLGSARVGEFA